MDWSIQILTGDDFYDVTPWVDLSEEELMEGLKRFYGVDI